MNHVVDLSHAEAHIMFTHPLGSGKSVADIMSGTIGILTK